MKQLRIISTAVFYVFSQYLYAQPFQAGMSDYERAVKKVGSVMYCIDNYYVDTANIKDLAEKAVINIMKSLDPHSSYVSKEEFNSMNEPLQGNFEGIGIEFNILNDTLMVVSPVPDGPSERVGLRSSDRIVAVNGENIAGVGITNDKVHKLLRGPKGSKLDITVKRADLTFDFKITRDRIPILSVDAAYQTDEIAYVKLNKFAVNSMKEIRDAWSRFENPASLILDLRGNSGGVMGTAIELADQFFDSGKLIVYTEGVNAPNQSEFSSDKGFFKKGKLVVLIDEGSASAGEIVAGAIQDWDRGILIGRRSFGKGLVQQMISLNDGSFIKLTVSRYHTPTGRVIQRRYDMGKTEEYYEDLYNRFSGEVYSAEGIEFPDSLKYQTLRNKRTVYGGGGIMPDIFVPLDTSSYSKYSGQLYRKGIVYQFILGYLDSNRDLLKAEYKTFERFDSEFEVDDEMFEDFIAYAEKEGVARDDEGLAISGNDLRMYIKALIARDVFTSSEYYKLMNRNDKVFRKALEVFKNWKQYENSILKNNTNDFEDWAWIFDF